MHISPLDQVLMNGMNARDLYSLRYVSPAARDAAAARSSKMLVNQVIFPQHVLQPQYIVNVLSEVMRRPSERSGLVQLLMLLSHFGHNFSRF
jgi:hypothetical protein